MTRLVPMHEVGRRLAAWCRNKMLQRMQMCLSLTRVCLELCRTQLTGGTPKMSKHGPRLLAFPKPAEKR